MAMRSGDVVRQGTVWIDKATGKKVANVRSDVLQKEYQEKVQNEYGSTSSMMYGQVISQQYGVPADIEKLTNWKYTTEQISFGMTPQGATADALAGIRYDQYSNVVTGDYLRAVNQIHNQERKEYWQGFGHGTIHQLTDIVAGTLKGITAIAGNQVEQQRMYGVETYATQAYDSIMGYIDDRVYENYGFFNADIQTDSYLEGRYDGRTAVKVAEAATMVYGAIRGGLAAASRLKSASKATTYWKTVLSKEGVFNGSLNAAINISATAAMSNGQASTADLIQAGVFGFVGGAALYPFSSTNLRYNIAERGLYSGLVGSGVNIVNQGVNMLSGDQQKFDVMSAITTGGLGVVGTYGAYGLSLQQYNKNLLNWMKKGYTMNESVRMQREWWNWSKKISTWTKYANTDGAATTIGGGVCLGLTWTYDKYMK